jgi:hypothetical protein
VGKGEVVGNAKGQAVRIQHAEHDPGKRTDVRLAQGLQDYDRQCTEQNEISQVHSKPVA